MVLPGCDRDSDKDNTTALTQTNTGEKTPEPTATPPQESGVDTGNKLEIHFIDVGKGESTLVITPDGKTMLVDGGTVTSSQEIITFLNNRNVKKIDVLVISHPHDDRIGGLSSIIDEFRIGKVYMPGIGNDTQGFDSLLTKMSDKSLIVETAKGGVNVPLGVQATVNFLAPIAQTYDHINDYSAVIRVVFGNTSLLLAGDIEKPSEDHIIANNTNLASSILKVANYGSSLSTSPEFLQAVSPKYSVIFTGSTTDSYPSTLFIDRLVKSGTSIFMTSECGTISFFSDGNEISMKTQKSPPKRSPKANT
jgi:beta-lactamase superfamily II metal-dependent hydrolase